MESKSLDSISQMSAKVQEFCEARDWDQFHNIKDLAIGLVTESAELLELFRFQSAEESEALLKDPMKSEMVRDEIADILFFVLRVSGRYGVDLGEALTRKLAKNAAKYPIELSRGSNRKYTEFKS